MYRYVKQFSIKKEEEEEEEGGGEVGIAQFGVATANGNTPEVRPLMAYVLPCNSSPNIHNDVSDKKNKS